MSAIKLLDIVDQAVLNWPNDYKRQLDEIIQKSRELGQGSSKKGIDELGRVQNQLSKATERSTQEYIKQKAELDKLNRSNREAVKEVNAQSSAYDSLSRRLEQNRKAYKDLAAQGKANTREAKALKNEVNKLDAQLKKIDNSVGQNQRSVGKYSNALQGLGVRFLGVVGAITAFVGILRNGLTIIRNYTKANSTLNAVLGVTSKQTKALRIQQKQLGETTAFSASEVAKAQTELARLGKTQRQIIDLTPAILDAAVAMGVDLAQAAELVAGQLNAFNLEADQGKRVSDVLVKATQISAFNFERLKVALSVVSPAANAVNASIEDTVAVLSSAVDANIDASTAATGLRNIYIDLADKGITWEEAMRQINTSQNKLSKANELFGKRGAVVATVIADNTEKINANTLALENADGAARKFAEETLNNLDGSLTLMSSAWEGFILSLEDGEGIITRISTAVVDLGTSFLTAFTNVNKFTASSSVGFWEKLGTVFGLVSGNAAVMSAQMAKIEAINAADQVKEMADALNEVAASDASSGLSKVVTETEKIIKLGEISRTNSPWADLRSDFIKYVETQKEGKDLIASLESGLAGAVESANQRKIESDKLAEERRTEIAKQSQQKRSEIINFAVESSKELFSGFTQLRIQQISDELNALEFARNRELEAAGESEAAKFQINQQFDQRRKALQRKQANAEKANAVFGILLNTALGIANAASKVVTLPLVPYIAGLGAAQLAIALAQKPPQFDKGSEHTPSYYIAGEKRPEFRISKGKVSLVKEPTLFTNSPGDKIVSGKETDSILGTISDITGRNILNNNTSLLSLLNNEMRYERPKDNLAYILQSNNEKLINTIKNKREAHVTVNKSGGAKVWEKSGNTIIYRPDFYYKR